MYIHFFNGHGLYIIYEYVIDIPQVLIGHLFAAQGGRIFALCLWFHVAHYTPLQYWIIVFSICYT